MAEANDIAQEINEEPIEINEVAKASLSPKAEEIFRGLWASLFYSGKAIGKAVLICSADSGEGASTIACGLALAGSTPAGSARVALVDFNLRKPSLHKMLGVNPSPGVGDVITGRAAPEDAAQRVNTSLDVYASGAADRRPEVLRSDKLVEFFAVLRDGYDRVLVDVASVNHYPDAAVLAGIINDAVLVAHSDHTPREAVAQAKKRLESGGGRLAGIVLNMRTYPIPGFLYRRV